MTCIAEFPLQIGLFHWTNCGVLDYQVATGPPCFEVTLTYPYFAPGAPFWLWVGPSVFTGVPEAHYVMHVCGITGPPPTLGACCAGPECTITTHFDCQGSWLGEGTSCNPNPCLPVPAQVMSWGRMKDRYR